MRTLLVLFIIIFSVNSVAGESLWVNNITVNENDMTWGYTETISGVQAVVYRINLDAGFGDNDSFINSWEILKYDKKRRESLRGSIEEEFDVKLDNSSSGIELIDIDAKLSNDAIGKTHSAGQIENRFNVTYRFKESILNKSSIWFLGQALTPVTITLPPGVDVTGVMGMENITNSSEHTVISGIFKKISEDRGEITLYLQENESFKEMVINATVNATPGIEGNVTEPDDGSLKELMPKIRYISLGFLFALVVLLIYVFKVRK